MKNRLLNKCLSLGCNMLVVGLLMTFNIQNASAQAIKSKKLKKQERRLQKFVLEKQSLIDTSFAFQTKSIKIPAVFRNATGGYLNIENKTVRIQELDWIDHSNIRTRIRDEGTLENYTLINQINTNSILVNFECRIKGIRYFFFIKHSLDDGSELRISKQKSEAITYMGKVHPL